MLSPARALRTSILSVLLAACSGSAEPLDVALDSSAPDVGPPAVDAGPTPFALTSTAYEEGGTIPLRHECGPPIVADGPGENISPQLAWTAGPPSTMSYAIVMRDRDAGNLVHWVIYDIPPGVRALSDGIAAWYAVVDPAGAHQAEIQGSGWFGFLGPCSSGSVNTYEIALHALSTPTLAGVDRGTSEDDVAAAIEAASIAVATLRGES